MRQIKAIFIVSILHHQYWTIQGSDVVQNRQFDPEHDDIDPANCSIPPRQDTQNYPKPQDGTCPSTSLQLSTLSDEKVHQLAEAYAPVLFFHPLEETSLQSVDAIFANPSELQFYQGDDPILLDSDDNPLEFLRSKPTILAGMDSYFQHKHPTDEYKRGAGYDYYPTNKNNITVGYARATIYYNVLDTGNGTWTFNYYFYYPWQRGQTVGFGLGRRQYSLLELHPFGQHEGDWESMRVLTCPSTTSLQPVAITYQQHGDSSQTTDCRRGDCIFWKDTTHPVGFVALNSHATYPTISRTMVYLAAPFHYFVSFAPGFVFLADHTLYRNEETGDYRMFFPNSTNLIRHQHPTLIAEGDVANYWQAYGGRWGSAPSDQRQPIQDLSSEEPRCLNPSHQTEWQECPSIPLLEAMLGFVDSYVPKVLGFLIPTIGEYLRPFDAPYGPPLQLYFYQWMPPTSAMLWSNTPPSTSEESFCTGLGHPITIENEDSYQEGTAARVIRLDMEGTSLVWNTIGSLVESVTGWF
jgi:hypothetical protein